MTQKIKTNRPTLEDMMKPMIMTCGTCGGTLHVIPLRKDLGKGKFTIETMNLCAKCTFGSESCNNLQ